jgi:hypothetical protein
MKEIKNVNLGLLECYNECRNGKLYESYDAKIDDEYMFL